MTWRASVCISFYKEGSVSLPATPVSVSRGLPRGTCAALEERKHIVSGKIIGVNGQREGGLCLASHTVVLVASRSRTSDSSKWPFAFPQEALR